ncbi:hypothetical protein PVAP13_5NG398024 [Panicum virgatum]|uniref:Uncharacterized protein n=1 Tax=Panicum virgatum TaxID=38727 RepID=A0A8T0RUB3_PANVG|nr:hypothetical protein PVAP13_5NG398024 [Panicum virgatum]
MDRGRTNQFPISPTAPPRAAPARSYAPGSRAAPATPCAAGSCADPATPFAASSCAAPPRTCTACAAPAGPCAAPARLHRRLPASSRGGLCSFDDLLAPPQQKLSPVSNARRSSRHGGFGHQLSLIPPAFVVGEPTSASLPSPISNACSVSYIGC